MSTLLADLSYLMPWALFLALVVGLIVFDLKGIHKKDHEVSIKESLILSAFYIFFALFFGIWVYYRQGLNDAQDYYVAYLVEKSLALDNIFVFSIIFQSFGIPKKYQHRVLFYGILGVVILRAIMLAFGIAIVNEFEWVLYIFGAFLVITGIKTLLISKENEHIQDNKFVVWISKKLRMTHTIHGNSFFIKIPHARTGKVVLHATPLLLALIVVEFVDVIFAVDSIPAVLAITQDPYVVYTSNIFAILGLRALYFSWAAIMHRFVYLKYALGLILVFIGGKIFYAELYGKVPASLSLGVTLGLLLGGVLYSLWKTQPGQNKV